MSLRSVCRRWLARSCLFLARPLQAMVVYATQRAKRGFVVLLLASARKHDIGLTVTRDSEDKAIEARRTPTRAAARASSRSCRLLGIRGVTACSAPVVLVDPILSRGCAL
jgi:DNA repair photolyase